MKTRQRTDNLKKAGYKVVEMWSHNWDVEREQHLPFPRSVSRHMPLDPRKALMGGRTNAVNLYAYTDEVEAVDEIDIQLRKSVLPSYRIRYIDVVSLYPTVMKQEVYPVGHPEILTSHLIPDLEECIRKIEEEEWFGVMKVDINPHKNLFFPVLPMIVNHRSMFGLCRTCMELEDDHEDKQFVCTHSKEDRRILDGTWTTFEKGYELETVHEVWHYPERSNKLFIDYIDRNFKDENGSIWMAHYLQNRGRERSIFS